MNTQVDGRGPTAPVRAPRCRMHGGTGNRCTGHVVDPDPRALQICPHHALQAALLLADAGAIKVQYAKVRSA